jgi:DNA-binding transcriptional ArsR family regulator
MADILKQLGIEGITQAVHKGDSQTVGSNTSQALRTLVLAALRGSQVKLSRVVQALTEPARRLRAKDRQGTEWAIVRGRLLALQELAQVLDAEAHPDTSDDVAQVLSDEMRRGILEVLDEHGPLSPKNISEHLTKLKKPSPTKPDQYKRLIELGLLDAGGATQNRWYAITPSGRFLLRQQEETRWRHFVTQHRRSSLTG